LGQKFANPVWIGLGWVFLDMTDFLDFVILVRTVTDARSQLSSSKVEAVELLKWGLDKRLI